MSGLVPTDVVQGWCADEAKRKQIKRARARYIGRLPKPLPADIPKTVLARFEAGQSEPEDTRHLPPTLDGDAHPVVQRLTRKLTQNPASWSRIIASIVADDLREPFAVSEIAGNARTGNTRFFIELGAELKKREEARSKGNRCRRVCGDAYEQYLCTHLNALLQMKDAAAAATITEKTGIGGDGIDDRTAFYRTRLRRLGLRGRVESTTVNKA